MSDTIKFQPGSIVITQGAKHILTPDETPHKLIELLQRHLRGDWGNVCDEDKKANEWSLKHGARVLSSYDVDGAKLWVITTADRSETCVMTPGEY